MCTKKLLLRILIVNTTLALIPPFLQLALEHDVSWHHLLGSFGYSLIYAHCIGSLAFATMPRVWIASEKVAVWAGWLLRAATAFGSALVGGLLACLIFIAIGWTPANQYWAEFLGSLKISIFLTVVACGFISMYESFRSRLEETTLALRTKELERERALKLATEAQLASLESRIHPHFLFNTLNSISSLIPEDPKRAEQLVERMAALLRFSLDANHSGLVPLEREIKIVSDYLAIEQARFGDRLRFQIDVPPEVGESKVPPLAIQTLVENSVKHAVARSRSGGEIRVALARDNGSLRIEVRDEGPEFALDAAPSGHGLDILKGRLVALFGQQAGLALERSGNRNQITLSVPQSANGHASVSG